MEIFSLEYLCGFLLVFLWLLAWCQGGTGQDSVTVLQYKQNHLRCYELSFSLRGFRGIFIRYPHYLCMGVLGWPFSCRNTMHVGCTHRPVSNCSPPPKVFCFAVWALMYRELYGL